MKDDTSKDYSSYDLDKLLDDYSKINSDTEKVESASPKKKKFVVHIDESLIDDKSEESTKSNSGGIYFSNFQKVSPTKKPNSNSNKRTETVKKSNKNPSEKAVRNANSLGMRTAAGFLAFIIIATAVLSYIGITCIGDMIAINRSEEVITVNIPADVSCSDIINILEDNGLIKRKLFCKLFSKYRNYDEETYLSGNYYLNSKMGLEGMLRDLMAAPVTADTIKLSFPEGWTIQQIFEKLEKYDVCDSNRLYTAVRTTDFAYGFLTEIPDSNKRYLKLEGYMFPDTYDFYVDADTNYVIRKFLDNFNNKWSDEYNAKAEKLGYTRDEIITIASIIQKEAANSDQMKTISSILHNRLNDPANYPTLGCDSTAIYISNYVTPVAGEGQGSMFYSYYDTNAVKGLPPGPICNPGIDAIRAALYPADTDYYYFAHDKNGKIYLAETYKEHKNNLVMIIKANNEG